MTLRLLPLLAALTATGCNGPFLVFPGGALEGQPAAAPPDWSFAGDTGTVQLETQPADPYSVNVAYTVQGGRLYVNAGDTRTRWAQHIAADPRVRLRMGGMLYELRADRVEDPDEIASFARAWTSQSFFRRDPTQLDEVWLYRLVAR